MTTINPWELTSELGHTSDFGFPNFALAKYMLVRIAPPKGKTIRDGVVATAVMVSYVNDKGEEIKTVVVEEGTGGYDVQFPLGKKNLQATKYRGPKSMYKFLNPDTKKFYQISNDKFTGTYAISYLSSSIQGWDSLSKADQDAHIDEYFENMYMFGMANDFALDTSKGNLVLPKVGMVTQFYRCYTPPKPGEKYGNTIITKWPPKGVPEAEGLKGLSGDYKEFNEAVAVAIHEKLQERDNERFSATDFIADGTEEDSIDG